MTYDPQIFKKYDIRGIYQEHFDEDTAYAIGRAFASLRKQETGQEHISLVVGRDMRISSPDLHSSLIKGLREGGADVVDIGLTSTPTFYFAVASSKSDGGIMVSASHNPAEWNGFKIVREKARPVSLDNGLLEIKKIMDSKNWSEPDRDGDLSEESKIIKKNLDHDLKYWKSPIKNFKVVADAANSMGASFLEPLFKHLPAELVKMNFRLDGSFPAHEADPLKEENMLDLEKTVLSEQADLGIATDGDGDRIFFVDDKGRSIDQSIIRGVLAKIFLREKPGSKICFDIRPGRITKDLIEENGGVPVITPVGHSLIKEIMIKEGSYFAGESSGHFFLNTDLGCYETPMIMIIKLLEEFTASGQKVSDYIEQYKKYFHSGEINSEADKEKVFAALEKKYHDGSISRLDGITVEYPDFWFNVRGSNTEPKVRLNLEARSRKIMEEKRNEVLEIIRS